LPQKEKSIGSGSEKGLDARRRFGPRLGKRRTPGWIAAGAKGRSRGIHPMDRLEAHFDIRKEQTKQSSRGRETAVRGYPCKLNSGQLLPQVKGRRKKEKTWRDRKCMHCSGKNRELATRTGYKNGRKVSNSKHAWARRHPANWEKTLDKRKPC